MIATKTKHPATPPKTKPAAPAPRRPGPYRPNGSTKAENPKASGNNGKPRLAEDMAQDAKRKAVSATADFKAAVEIVAAAPNLPVVNPNSWFKQRFPTLAEKLGEPVALRVPTGGRPSVQDLNESFMAATLGNEASPESPTIFLRPEGRFYCYRPELGIFTVASEEDLAARLSRLLLECARDCREACDVSALEFQQRDSAALAGAVKRAKASLVAPDDFFASAQFEEFLPVRNGVLRISDRTLLPFSPDYRRRNKLAVDYVAGARCPLFMDTLLRASLEEEDIGLLQRCCGLFLVGRNIAQRMLLLSGTAGAGKGCFVRVLKGIIGDANIGSLRTGKLNERFEIGRLINRTLLYGADVPANFLNKESASTLKSLTGGDPMDVEIKNSMDSPSLNTQFNVIVTSNSRLIVHLEGDVDAWQRRLAIVSYERPAPANKIPDLDKRIVSEEGPGVLNWMIDGLYAIRAANWQIALAPRQQARVDDLLLESNSVTVFLTECCIADTLAAGITVLEVHGAYCDFCMDRGWNPLDRYKFGSQSPEMVQRLFRLAQRHDVKGQDGKSQRGWKGLRLLKPEDVVPD